MADLPNTLKSFRKVEKELSSSRSFLFSGDSTVSAGNGGRLTLLPSFKPSKFVSDLSNLDQSTRNKEKYTAVYENYEIKYSIYLLRKLQNYVLKKGKVNNEENFKKSLVSLKLELEECLKKHVYLSKVLLYAETYLKTIRECNKRIKLGEIVNVLEENNVDVLFESISNMLDPAINQLRLIGLQENEVERFFIQDIKGKKTELIECLKNILNYSEKNSKNLKETTEEILKIKDLIDENVDLRKKHNKMINNITAEILEANYENLAEIVKKVISRRLNLSEGVDSNFFKLFKVEEFLSCTENPISPEALHTMELFEHDKIIGEKPIGTSTPQP